MHNAAASREIYFILYAVTEHSCAKLCGFPFPPCTVFSLAFVNARAQEQRVRAYKSFETAGDTSRPVCTARSYNSLRARSFFSPSKLMCGTFSVCNSYEEKNDRKERSVFTVLMFEY